MTDRVCDNCGGSMEGKRRQAKFCCDDCRREAFTARRALRAQEASGTVVPRADGRLTVVAGPRLRFTVPADWPSRSARFWALARRSLRGNRLAA